MAALEDEGTSRSGEIDTSEKKNKGWKKKTNKSKKSKAKKKAEGEKEVEKVDVLKQTTLTSSNNATTPPAPV